MEEVRIGGLVPFSTVDWPGKIVAVAFLCGCPWRCPYCQNSALWESRGAGKEGLIRLMEGRHGLLDGIVISGGEPLMQPGAVGLAREVRDMGFEVGLHTGGAYPDRLREILPYLSWVGFDVKAPWGRYDGVTRTPGSGERARESFDILVGSGIDMECRTTWHPDLLTPGDISVIGRTLADAGVRRWAIQAYRDMGTPGELDGRTVYPSDVPEDAMACVPGFTFRRA